MELDQYLYCSTKENVERIETYRNTTKEYFTQAENLYNKYKPFLDAIPDFGEGEITMDQYIKLHHIEIEYDEQRKAIAKNLNIEIDDVYFEPIPPNDIKRGNELGYWDQYTRLHKFIVDNFGNPDEDNCRNIYLNKKQIERIIEWVKNDNDPYYKDATILAFQTALQWLEHDMVVYYWAWY